MEMRLRIPELLEAKGVSPYRLSRDSGGRISLSTAYRLRRTNGQLATYKAAMMDAICDVLGVNPSELLEREPAPSPRKPTRKRAA